MLTLIKRIMAKSTKPKKYKVTDEELLSANQAAYGPVYIKEGRALVRCGDVWHLADGRSFVPVLTQDENESWQAFLHRCEYV